MASHRTTKNGDMNGEVSCDQTSSSDSSPELTSSLEGGSTDKEKGTPGTAVGGGREVVETEVGGSPPKDEPS